VAKPLTPLLIGYMGLIVQGDIGPWTCYHHPGLRTVVYESTSPKQPPSRLQVHQRNRLRLAAKLWQLLSPAQRAAWETAARRAHLRISGYDLWTAAELLRRPDLPDTIARQTGIYLPRHPDDLPP